MLPTTIWSTRLFRFRFVMWELGPDVFSSLLHQLQNARGIGVDVSQAAIAIAQENADAHKVTDRLTFTVSDCFNALPKHLSFDLIVSNPPTFRLPPCLACNERFAITSLGWLYRGVDGLSIIRRLLQDSPQYLKEGGLLVMEIGFDQGESTEALIQSNVWDLLEIVPDLADSSDYRSAKVSRRRLVVVHFPVTSGSHTVFMFQSQKNPINNSPRTE